MPLHCYYTHTCMHMHTHTFFMPLLPFLLLPPLSAVSCQLRGSEEEHQQRHTETPTAYCQHKPNQNGCYSSRDVQRLPPHPVPSHKRGQPQTDCPPHWRGGNTLTLLSLHTWQPQEEGEDSHQRQEHTHNCSDGIVSSPDPPRPRPGGAWSRRVCIWGRD